MGQACFCLKDDRDSEELAFGLVQNHKLESLDREIKHAQRELHHGVDSRALASYFKSAREFVAKYTLERHLSAGAQGVTYIAREVLTGKRVVVKKPNDPSDTTDFTSLAAKTHPNVVRVFECFHNPLETYIVMELCSGGDLFKAVQGMQDGVTQNWCAAVFEQVIKGVHYIHTQFLESHNDIKPENILLDRKPISSLDVPRAMIGDFGCLTAIGAETQASGAGGDPRYRAPETFRDVPFSVTTDVWSLGVTLFEIVSGGLLIYINRPNVCGWEKFKTVEGGTLCWRFLSYLRTAQPVDLSMFGHYRRLPALLQGLLDANPAARITLTDALRHPWFQLASPGAEQAALGRDATAQLKRRNQNHHFNMVLLDVVTRRLQGESIKYYQEIWEVYDSDGDGIMPYEEFEEMCLEAGLTARGRCCGLLGSASNADPEELFDMADLDGSGFIDFNEFVALMFNADALSDEEKLKYFRSAFHEIAGSDGLIEVNELASLFKGYSAGEVYELFACIDEDGSGYIDVKEFEEYLKML